MTVLAATLSPAETLLADLTPNSGLALRRWTPDEFRRLVSSGLLGANALDLADGEIVDCDSHALYLFNREEYYSLAEQGILGPEERTELIYGRIITRMSPIGWPHSISVSKTADALETAFGDAFFTLQQMSLHVLSGLEPQPDVMVLAGVPDDYADVPRPADVLLLVEISYSTLNYDRGTKSGMYAENGIAEYWIVNLRSRTLEVYRQPEGDTYISLRVYDETEAVAPLAAPNAAVRVADLLPMVPPALSRCRPAADGAACSIREITVNTCLTTFCIVLSCLAVPACIVKAAPKPLSPAGAAQALSEKDVLGDWQTYGEGWRIMLNADHTAAIYMEGYGEVGPFASTWKLVANDVIVNMPSSLKKSSQYVGTDLIVIPYKSELVLLPREELSVAEKHGFAATLCLWRVAQKQDSRKY